MVSTYKLKEILTEKAYEDLNIFLKGQTIGMNKDGSFEIYNEDLIRWMNNLPVID